jgi:hypothetical protein
VHAGWRLRFRSGVGERLDCGCEGCRCRRSVGEGLGPLGEGDSSCRVAVVEVEPFGERVRLWCRAGISAEDIGDEVDRLRAALWCQDVRVIRDRRRSALVTVEVVRRDPLGGKRPVRSELLDQLNRSGT